MEEIILSDNNCDIIELINTDIIASGNIQTTPTFENIILESNENCSTLEYVEIVTPHLGSVDEHGNILLIKEVNSLTPSKLPSDYVAENVSNKRGDLSDPSNLTYPTTKAVDDALKIGTDKYYRHIQNTPSKIWIITHGLNKRPSIAVSDSAGTLVEGALSYIDVNTVKIEFSASFSGFAELN